MTIDRAWYTALVDDSGGGVDGSIIDKADLLALLDDIDELFDTEITPAALAADQNDYYPTGTDRAAVIVLAATAARNISGLGYVAGSNRRKLLVNTSAFTLTLKHDVTSSAGNRFKCPNNVDFALRQGGSVLIHYRTANGYWYVIGP